MRFVVLGAGLMGRAVLYDLARSEKVSKITVADYERERAVTAVRQFGRDKARATRADAREPRTLAHVLAAGDVVVNCTQYYWNLNVMEAALRARTNYVDLGGLYHVTRRQLRLDAEFRRAGKLALIGMGGAPGITNVIARFLADQFDRVEKIGIYNGAVELNPPSDPLAYTFSFATILDEMTLPPVVFHRGRYQQHLLFSGGESVRFSAPLGRLVLRNSLHSELATLPRNFRSHGLREAFFKINYDPKMVEAVQLLKQLGFLERRPVQANGARVSPRSLLEALVRRMAVSTAKARDIEILRVVVSGKKARRRRRLSMEAAAAYSLRPNFSAVARDTGFPASIAAQMIAAGEIEGRGVRAPEEVVPPHRFFAELEARGIKLSGSGWEGGRSGRRSMGTSNTVNRKEGRPV